MNKNLSRFFISLGIVFVVFTVIAFTLPFAHNAVFWIAYSFGIISIGLQMYIIPKAFEKPGIRSKFYGFPIARVGVIYVVVQLVLSILFMALSSVESGWVVRVEIILCVVILGAAALGFITTDVIRDEIEHQDTKLKKDVSRMRALQAKTASLRDQCDNAEAKAALAKLADAFRFSDPVSGDATIELENELAAYADELQAALTEGDYANVSVLCAKIAPVLAQRNQLCKSAK